METNEIKFIGREKELRLVLDFFEKGSNLSSKAVFISGEGGIGKTRLLDKIGSIIKEKFNKYTIHRVIDFDNRKYKSPEGVSLAIIEELPDNEDFIEYFDLLDDARKIEKSDVTQKTIDTQYEKLINSFVTHYNHCVKDLNIWLFDTIEKLSEPGKEIQINQEIINDWIKKFPRLSNSFFIFVGRNPALNQIRKEFEKSNNMDILNIELQPLPPEESSEYIKEKQEKLHLSIKKELTVGLIKLSGGKPIYLDLAVEWFIQKVDMDWLENIDTNTISKKTQLEFEEKLISKIRELRYPIDWFVFVLAHIYPLEKKAFEILFDDEDQIGDTFEWVKKMVFVKTLPNGEIKLHDEMQRIVSNYIFDKIDDKLRRRQYYSQKIIDHLQAKYTILEKKYNQDAKKNIDSYNARDRLNSKIELEAEKIDLNELTNQLIIHSFYANVEAGKQKLHELGEELISGRLAKHEVNSLLESLDMVSKAINFEQDIDFLLGQAKLQFYAGKNEELGKLKNEATEEQLIEINLLQSNYLVRKGDITRSMLLLKEAEQISDKIGSIYQKIKLEIDLGWNYRLIGNLKNAKEKYEYALQMILKKVGDDPWEKHEDLAVRYGWTQNNLAFVLSDTNNTRREAVSYAESAIDHWKTINHRMGLGAGHSVLGITFYRIDKFEDALEQFEKAQEIFEELGLEGWICQIHSWRGALYQDRNQRGDQERAREELTKALTIAKNVNKTIIPMTLNRLGRVYMTRKEWALALQIMQDSLQQAKELPDYVYWLGTIGRMGYILAEFPESGLGVEYLRKEFEEFNSEVKKKGILHESNSLGITNLALARLELLALREKTDKNKIDEIINLLKESIPLITVYGSYARTDIRSRLVHFEQDFQKIDPDILHTIGNELYDFVKLKTSENSSYYIVMGIMNKWKNWQNEK